MTAFIANTRVDIARETGAVDAWDDETGAVATVQTGVPAAVTEQAQRNYLGTDERGGQVEQFTVRLRPATDVREGDRLTTREGLVLQVETVTTAPALAGLADVRCTARRTAALSTP